MEIPIPEHVKKLWDLWNLRAFILLSLSLQTFLILFAPFRKRTANKYAISLIWSAYLLADWAANFAVGLISSSESGTTTGSVDNGDLLAFWAPFLLLHLGGPDTITAFALEDNELWLRHLFGLVFQVLAAAYVFLQTLPKNNLWVPTMLLFFAGLIKYAERTRALYLASLERFRESMLTDPDPGPNYAKLMEEYASKKEAGLPTRITILQEPDKETAAANTPVKEGELSEIEVVQYAYDFFKKFKGLIVDLIFSFRERHESRNFFLERNAKDAFRVIEVELNFIYEVLFTKVEVVHSRPGYVFRLISFAAVMVGLGAFYTIKKHGFTDVDIVITYTLLLGAIALDSIALFMLIFSDWTVAALKKPRPLVVTILSKFLAIKSSTWWPRFLFRRWSKSFSTYNLIDYCVKERSKKFNKSTNGFIPIRYLLNAFKVVFDMFCEYSGLNAFLEEFYYVHTEPFTDILRDFIFEELHMKSDMAEYSETAKEICESRGDRVLRNYGCSNLLHWIVDIDYDESLLLWHIATELCCKTDDDRLVDNDNRTFSKLVSDNNDSRTFSKLLSDYMLYLLVMQPAMMSAVAGIGQIRSRDTCAEAIKFFSRGELKIGEEHKDACRKLLEVNTDVRPSAVKGDRSKSVLFDACMLAKELNELNHKKWEIISKVWVEMLSYAATNCRANTHVQQVSKGGELVTFVWLLMAHFGLGGQFQIKEGHARAKLIVGK